MRNLANSFAAARQRWSWTASPSTQLSVHAAPVTGARPGTQVWCVNRWLCWGLRRADGKDSGGGSSIGTQCMHSKGCALGCVPSPPQCSLDWVDLLVLIFQGPRSKVASKSKRQIPGTLKTMDIALTGKLRVAAEQAWLRHHRLSRCITCVPRLRLAASSQITPSGMLKLPRKDATSEAQTRPCGIKPKVR